MMRLGISLQEGYLIILATLIVLQGAGTIYGLWAQGRAATPEAVRWHGGGAWLRWSCSLRSSPFSC